MECTECHKEFDPHENAGVAGTGDFLEIVTNCPHCAQGYFTSIKAEELLKEES